MPNFLDWDEKRLERYFNALYNGDFDARNLPPELYEAILDKLTEGVVKGFGGITTDKTRRKAFTGLIDNLAVFSAAKTYQQVNDMSNFLFDANGNKNPFSVFKEAANEIFETYNDNWLRTEYSTAIGMSQSASQWLDYERDAEALPLLQYETVNDERVRHDHADLDGIIKPVGDPFWDTNAPLNGFNCRCRLRQLEEGEETDLEALEKKLGRPIVEPDKLFKFNPGKKRIIFDETVHPYFKVDKRYKIASKEGVKQPPRKPKPTKKKLPPKVVPKIAKNGVFKTKVAARKYITDSIEANSKIKVKSVTVSSALSIESISRRVNTLSDLFKEYKLGEALDSTAEATKIRFKSTKRVYGVVKSGQNRRDGTRFIREVNLGDASDTIRSRGFVKGGKDLRFKSAVDNENLEIATTVHEFAHVISVQDAIFYSKSAKADISFFKELAEIRSEYYKELSKLKPKPEEVYKIHLGKYAGTNLNEFMAEGFTEYKLSSNPTKYAVKIGELIDKFYKK